MRPLEKMNFAIYFLLSVTGLTLARAKIPLELGKMLGLNSTTEISNDEVNPSAERSFQDGLVGIFSTVLSGDRNVHFDNIKSPKMLSAARDAETVTSVEDAMRNFKTGHVEHYTPSPVGNTECYVEYHVTHRAPGRCIRLGGRIPACQSDEYLDINHSECN
ncbi:uncharacterized protein LOC118193034 [Stegodyphus dumicola]|uniref:uncharacterized protein LOC118193034 n=1 Tax=Stegodyphus dumicola TaxID=202533 RepID=UPI0015B2A41A|nr:uncharacterized protein LOC118193034 [Stegodyphus dumicola]